MSKRKKCIECSKPAEALDRCSTHYKIFRRRNDIEYFISEKFGNVRRRVNNPESIHYRLDLCSKEDFIAFSIDNPSLNMLWNSWKDHNYIINKCPSIDRIDPKQGYIIGNLQWITHSYNSGKDKNIPVKAYKDGELVGEFQSSKEAESKLGVCRQNICKVLKGTRKSAGGYTFET